MVVSLVVALLPWQRPRHTPSGGVCRLLASFPNNLLLRHPKFVSSWSSFYLSSYYYYYCFPTLVERSPTNQKIHTRSPQGERNRMAFSPPFKSACTNTQDSGPVYPFPFYPRVFSKPTSLLSFQMTTWSGTKGRASSKKLPPLPFPLPPLLRFS